MVRYFPLEHSDLPTYLPMTVIDRQTDNGQYSNIYMNEKQYTCETLSKKDNNAHAISRQEKYITRTTGTTISMSDLMKNSKTNSEVK